jgi:diguanylate cyclase (GGDEF)-like protein
LKEDLVGMATQAAPQASWLTTDFLAAWVEAATEDLEFRPMLQRIVDLLHEKSGADRVAIFRVDRDRGRFVLEAVRSSVPTLGVPGYGRELGSGVVGRVALTGQPVVLDEVTEDPGFVETTQSGMRSEACLPVRHRGELVAVLNLESSKPGFFKGQLASLEAVVNVLAGAISGFRLIDALREKCAELELVCEVLHSSVTGDSLETALRSVVKRIQEAFDLAVAAIVVADEEDEEWEDLAIALRGRVLPLGIRSRWPTSEGVVGRAIRLGQPVLVEDVSRDPDYFAVDPGVRAEYVVPFRLQGKILGALNLESKDPAVFSSRNCALFRHLAAQLVAPIALARANRDLLKANQELERLSRTDPLTGVANRRAFEEVLAREWRRAWRSRQPLSVVFFDVDFFKLYNDSQGHGAGDEVLRTVGSLLRQAARRAEDFVARYGGEEFVMLLPGLEFEKARQLAEGARTALENLKLPHPGSPFGWISLSAGVAGGVPAKSAQPVHLIEAADRALYQAKASGRNRVTALPLCSERPPKLEV